MNWPPSNLETPRKAHGPEEAGANSTIHLIARTAVWTFMWTIKVPFESQSS